MNRSSYRQFFGGSMLVLSVMAGALANPVVAADGASPGKAPAIDSLIEPLQKKLQDNPEDAGNWALLGRSYEYLGRRQDAEKAFARARELGYELPATPTPRVHQSALDPVLLRWMAETTRRPVAGEPGAK